MSLIFHFYLWKDIISQRDIFVRNNQGSKSLFMERNLAPFWKAYKFIWFKYEHIFHF